MRRYSWYRFIKTDQRKDREKIDKESDDSVCGKNTTYWIMRK